jgi:hypothetical protein
VRQRRAQHGPSGREKPDPKRRGNFLRENKAVLLASGAIAAAAFISFAVILLLNGAPPLQSRERKMLKNYEEVRVSLAHDDLTTAERLAANMAREFGNWVSVSSSFQLIANSDSLESARKAFAKLSEEAIRLADRHPEYLILRCPTDCPENCLNCRSNEFGSWVQIDTLVGNPFMGTASPHCGARIQ